MKKLYISDMQTVELSIDQVGKILFYKNRVFRAINDDYIEQVMDMFDCGLIDEISNKTLFPKTWISDIQIDEYSLVVEHEQITYWNYPYEWSFDMLRDAGLLILEVNKIANKYGYQLRDSHSSNVVFNMNQPQYTDLGSFGKFDKDKDVSWVSYNIFYNHFYMPLYLWSNGYSDIGRNIFLMMHYFNEKEFFKLKHPILTFLHIPYAFKVFKKLTTIAFSSKIKIKTKFTTSFMQSLALLLHRGLKYFFNVNNLENEIINLKRPTEPSMWNDYHDTINPKTNKRFLRIIEIIDNLDDAKSLVELASNQGKFASYVLENTHIEKMIATDYDKEAVNIMYLNNKNRNNFLPLLFDMVRTNGRKYDEYMYKRIKSDIVMALAVTHHLLLTQDIPIDNIFKTMRDLTNKYIIVEFMPIGLYSGDMSNIPKLPDFYNSIWFKDKFIQYFDLILEEEIDINRHIFIGKLKIDNKNI